MNPLTNMKNVLKLSEQELHTKNKTSWHDQYRDSAWVFIGGLPYDLTEGDIVCIFSQYGEIVNINLIRDKDSGKSKGFCFLCYEDQRSTDLAVDNFNGISILKRKIRVDHVSNYKVPKTGKKTDEETKKLYQEGCAPKPQPIQMPSITRKQESIDYRETLSDQIAADIKLPARLPIYPIKQEPVEEDNIKEETKEKKDKKKKKKKKKKSKHSDSESSSDDGSNNEKKKRSKNKGYSSDESEKKKRKYQQIKMRSRSNSEERDYKGSSSKTKKDKYDRRRYRSRSNDR